MEKRYLICSDGTVYEGEAFGGNSFQMGELVFHSGMCGYQEIISDLAYSGQLVMMTYPLMGNYGINRDDFESLNPGLFGLVTREVCDSPSNFRCDTTLDAYLKAKNIPGIAGLDTRAITKKLRRNGTLMAVMSDTLENKDEIVAQLKEASVPSDLVAHVSTQKTFPIPGSGKRVVLIDLGTKHQVIRELSLRNCDVIVAPYNISLEDLRALHADAIVLSSGPGNPADLTETISLVKELRNEVAMLGIGLGSEVIALACGAEVKKMLYGHRGNSIPVVSLAKNRVEFTLQNHGYEVVEASLAEAGLEVTFRNLNDKSVEGFKDGAANIYGVAFNPEAAPGSNDTNYVFDEFVACMK